ncbi:MAG: phosphoserine phosphatase SerB [Pseudomonadota bacterium]
MPKTQIITLIAPSDSSLLDHATAMRLSSAVEARAMNILSPGSVVELVSDADKPVELIKATLGDPDLIDIAVQPWRENRRKRLLLADMDSTMIQQECIDELAAEVGVKEHVSQITRRAMNGEIEFDAALRERVALLKGLPASIIDKVIADRITLMPGGPELVRTMRKHGAYCALVSGGFTDFTSRIAEIIGFQENRANQLEKKDGLLTGKVLEPILGKQAKLDTMNALCDRLRLTRDDVLAVGDGANDLAMIEAADLGVALHAKPSVAAQADVRIDHGDLTALLYLQGYRENEFVK